MVAAHQLQTLFTTKAGDAPSDRIKVSLQTSPEIQVG
jgi:hypothetical protein